MRKTPIVTPDLPTAPYVENIGVQPDGRCSEISVVKSSGFPKLDEAAVKEVQRNWKLVPAKEDGKPVAAWFTFAVTFRLTD